MASVDWPTRPATTARSTRGWHNVGVSCAGQHAADLDGGHETTFPVNLLAPHLLTHMLSVERRTGFLGTCAGHTSSRVPCCPRHLPRLSERRTAHRRNVVFCGVKIFRIADDTIVQR